MIYIPADIEGMESLREDIRFCIGREGKFMVVLTPFLFTHFDINNRN